jgi:paraquat-inducible protein B
VTLERDRIRLATGEGQPEIDLEDLIKRGLRAELNMQSFVTGEAEIRLDFDPNSAPELHPGTTDLVEIPTRPSAFQRVAEQLKRLPIGELVQDAIGTLQSLRALSDKLDVELPPVLARFKDTSEGAGRMIDTATMAIADLRAQIASVLARVDRLAGSADQQVNQRGADLHALLVSATQTTQQASNLMVDLRGFTGVRAESRANLEATLRDLAAATAALRGFADDVEHNPQLLLTGRRQ